MESKNWFEVSKEGLRELQEGKSKSFVLKELVQNAWDENTKKCVVKADYENEVAKISVEDDNPEGFRDLTDSYTLFQHTEKRKNPEKRGRFNIGEKQILSICEEATVETTKGTVVFDVEGRRNERKNREKGSKITVKIKMKREEYQEMLDSVKTYLIPKGIYLEVNGEKIKYIQPYKTFEASLLTEIEENRIMKRVFRKTNVNVVKSEAPILYEMGLPIQKIECEFSIDVQQKIPLSIDRDVVLPSFLTELYAEVLNHIGEDITEINSSQVWVREATTSKRIDEEILKEVINKRFGDKVCVADPFDRRSIDEAIASGYRVVRGSEMSKEEWENVKGANLICSSSKLFGATFVEGEEVKELSENQMRVRKYAQKIAERLLKFGLKVVFVKSRGDECASFGNDTLTFNISRLPKNFFNNPISAETTDLILHELGHKEGWHVEKSYHQAITKMAGELIMLALKEPAFFEV